MMISRLYTYILFTSMISSLLVSCVQETHIKKVSFEVNMKGVQNFESVGIRGDIKPLSWQETSLLSDDNNDSIYTSTLEFDTAGNQLNFKFVINGEVFELDGTDNRVLPFEYKMEELIYSTSFDQETFEIIKK